MCFGTFYTDTASHVSNCRFISLGIYGMDFYVVLNRPGYRVAKRKEKVAKIGYQHKVTKSDAVKWFQVSFMIFHDRLQKGSLYALGSAQRLTVMSTLAPGTK